LLKPEDAKRFARSRTSEDGAAEAEGPRQHSAALVRRLTAHRTLALRATLMQRPDIAVVALTHRLVLRTLLTGGYWTDSAVRIDPDTVELEQHAPDLRESKAHAAIEAQRERLLQGLPQDPSALIEWLLQQPQAKVVELLAFCVALTVDAVTSEERSHSS